MADQFLFQPDVYVATLEAQVGRLTTQNTQQQVALETERATRLAYEKVLTKKQRTELGLDDAD